MQLPSIVSARVVGREHDLLRVEITFDPQQIDFIDGNVVPITVQDEHEDDIAARVNARNRRDMF
jgi:hypothetical protein